MQVSRIFTNYNFKGKFTEIDVQELEFPRDRIRRMKHRVLYNPYSTETKEETKANIDNYRRTNEKTTTKTIRGKEWSIIDRIIFYIGKSIDENSGNENV